MTVAAWIILGIFVLIIGPMFVTSFIVYEILLVRTKPEKWGRECSMPEDEEVVTMHKLGLDWANENISSKSPVQITSDGLRLCGEYFDFGFDKAVIIIAGRMESCLYGYYFAAPFKESGYNVLVIDNRAHGESEGKYSCLGYKEYLDILEWGRFLHDDKGNKKILLHGICIGSSTALFVLTDKNCPEYFEGMIAEGMYKNFYESLRNHMIEQRRPTYPSIYVIVLYIWIFSKARIMSDGPYKRIKKMNRPILFLHGRQDIYSVPALAQGLYDICPAKTKDLHWFEIGKHSRLRINNTKDYDDAIKSFIARL